MDKLIATGPDIPDLNLGGRDWQMFESWLGEKRTEVYAALAKESTSWEDTLILRGQATFIEKLLDLRRNAAILNGRV